MQNILSDIKKTKQDAVIFKASYWLAAAKDDPYEKTNAIKRIVKLISCIRDKDLRYYYAESIADGRAPHRIKFKGFHDQVEALCATADDDHQMEEVSNWDRLPGYMNRDDLMTKGFCEVDTPNVVGYFGWGAGGKMEISDFIIKPLFQVKGKGEDSRHIFEVKGRYTKSTIDVKSKVLVSVEAFQTELVAEGVVFFGVRNQLLRITKHLLPMFPKCDEIKELGWQPEGFFAFVDCIYIPKKKEDPTADNASGESEFGMREIGSGGVFEVGNKHFLIPAASSVYADMREDIFEAQRVLRFIKSPVDFATWSSKMQIVYGEDGLVGIAYILCSSFRDILFAIDHNFPHLYAYGETSSGKSKFAESLTAVFYKGRAAFNLNSGTEFAFYEYVKAFRNGLAHLNEFDDKFVRDEWFQAIKGFYDGEGRQKGKMGTRTGTQTQRAESGIILTGQYQSTKDDNSVVNRSIVRAFHQRQFSDEEKKHYDELKQWEAVGLSALIPEMIELRSKVKSEYYDIYNHTLVSWRKKTTDEYNSRIFQNWSHMASMWKLASTALKLPITADAFEAIAYKQAKDLSKFVRSSDTLSEFWNTVVFLLDEGKIQNGWDFRIEVRSDIKLRKGDGDVFHELFNEPRKLLIIRLNNVHKHYQKTYKERTGKEGMSLDNLTQYFKNRPYYVGQIPNMQFKRHQWKAVESTPVNDHPLDANSQPQVRSELKPETTITSAYVFDYDILGCELDRDASSSFENLS